MNYGNLFNSSAISQFAIYSLQDNFKAHTEQIERMQLQLSEPATQISKTLKELTDKLKPTFDLMKASHTKLATEISSSDMLNVVNKMYQALDPILKRNSDITAAATGWILNVDLDSLKFLHQDSPQHKIVDVTPQTQEKPAASTPLDVRAGEDISQLNVTLFNSEKLVSSEENISTYPSPSSNDKKVLSVQKFQDFELEISLKSPMQSADEYQISWPLDIINFKYTKVTEDICFYQQGAVVGFYNKVSGEKFRLTPTNYRLVNTLMKRYTVKNGITPTEAGQQWKTFQNLKSELKHFFCGDIIGYDRSRKMMFWNPRFLPNPSGKR